VIGVGCRPALPERVHILDRRYTSRARVDTFGGAPPCGTLAVRTNVDKWLRGTGGRAPTLRQTSPRLHGLDIWRHRRWTKRTRYQWPWIAGPWSNARPGYPQGQLGSRRSAQNVGTALVAILRCTLNSLTPSDAVSVECPQENTSLVTCPLVVRPVFARHRLTTLTVHMTSYGAANPISTSLSPYCTHQSSPPNSACAVYVRYTSRYHLHTHLPRFLFSYRLR
jgi:hypothetical protein